MNMNAETSLGSIIRRIRVERGWTITQMAREVKLPLSTLAKVERDELSLTYNKLVALSTNLGMELSDMLSSDRGISKNRFLGRRSIATLGSALNIRTDNYDYAYLCTELRHKIMTPIIIRLLSRSIHTFGVLEGHEGEEFIYVLSGVVEVHSEVYEKITIEEGSGLYFDSETPHAFTVATGSSDAVILCICASRGEDLQKQLLELAASNSI